MGSHYEKDLYFELNYDIKRFENVRALPFLSLLTPPPHIFSRYEEIVPSVVTIRSKFTHGTLSNIQFLEIHCLFTCNGQDLHIKSCFEEL